MVTIKPSAQYEKAHESDNQLVVDRKTPACA